MKAAFFRMILRDLQRQPVNPTFRFPQPDEARTHEQRENFLQAKILYAIVIQLARFIIDRRHLIASGLGQLFRQIENVGIWFGEGIHLPAKLFLGKSARAIKDGAVQVFVQT